MYLQWCIQDDMNTIMKYFRINKLTLNLNKTVCVLFQKDKKSKEIRLQLDIHTITNSPETKFLGMILDQNLNWSSHLNQLIHETQQKPEFVETEQKHDDPRE